MTAITGKQKNSPRFLFIYSETNILLTIKQLYDYEENIIFTRNGFDADGGKCRYFYHC